MTFKEFVDDPRSPLLCNLWLGGTIIYAAHFYDVVNGIQAFHFDYFIAYILFLIFLVVGWFSEVIYSTDTVGQGWFESVWLGQARLWKVFWGGQAIGIIASILTILLVYLLEDISSILTIGLSKTIHIAFSVWYGVGIWRCSANTTSGIWTGCAYVAVGLIALNVAYSLFTAFRLI